MALIMRTTLKDQWYLAGPEATQTCGEPWCVLIQRPGSGVAHAAPFGVERVGGRLYIVGVAGGLAPKGCTVVDDPRVVDGRRVVH